MAEFPQRFRCGRIGDVEREIAAPASTESTDQQGAPAGSVEDLLHGGIAIDEIFMLG